MHIVSLKMLRDFWHKHPESERPLRHWHTVAEHSWFVDFTDLRGSLGNADYVAPYTVFDVGGTLRNPKFGATIARNSAGSEHETDRNYEIMLNEQMIREAVRRLVAAAHAPSKIIMFGSYARGDADEGSDLDLVVIEREVPSKGEELLRLNQAVGWIGKGVDVLLYSEREFDRRSQVPGTAPYWAHNEGRVLYDAAA
jgi:predicted nucleotidyltransferase